MRKTVLLNSEVSYVISQMGHFDTLAIGDAGLPIPAGVRRIDLAVKCGVPSFTDVFSATVAELEVQKAIIAEEMREGNPELYKYLILYFEDKHIPVEEMPHEEFKDKTADSRAVVRTGECTPYANIILESGVTF